MTSKFSWVTAAIVVAFLVGCGGFVYTTVGGTVKGLNDTGSAVTLVDSQNYQVTVTADGTFSFKVASNAKYDIAVLSQPSAVNCLVVNGKGTMTGEASRNDIMVNCVPNVAVGGVYRGLYTSRLSDLTDDAPYVQIVLNDISRQKFGSTGTVGDPADPTADGVFLVSQLIVSGQPYNVKIAVQPIGEICTLQNGVGIADNSVTVKVNNLALECKPAVPVAGTINGLTANDVIILANNSSDSYGYAKASNDTTTDPVAFRFDLSVDDTSPYAVTVYQQPTGKTCTVTNGAGTATLSNRTGASNVVVNCVKN